MTAIGAVDVSRHHLSRGPPGQRRRSAVETADVNIDRSPTPTSASINVRFHCPLSSQTLTLLMYLRPTVVCDRLISTPRRTMKELHRIYFQKIVCELLFCNLPSYPGLV